MYCEYCGAKLPGGANVCPQCGSTVRTAGENNQNESHTDNFDNAEGSFSSQQNPNGQWQNPGPDYQQQNYQGWQGQYQQNQYAPPNYNNYQGAPNGYPPYPPQGNPKDKKSVILNIISFFIPLIGLILYLVEKDDKPIKAKSIGKSALAGFIIGIVISLFSSLLSVGLLGFASSDDSSGSDYSYEMPSDSGSSDYDENYFDDFSLE